MAEYSDNDKKSTLDALTYKVCRLGHTEPPFSGTLLHNINNGVYHCTCCNAALFDSQYKFDAGCGWPSFSKSRDGAVRYLEDLSKGMQRTEIRCATCDSHLGHVFEEKISGNNTRYCVNSVSMSFEKEEDMP